jgi:TolB-like protein/DNA-binding winged helix-turn-helix (wHTH) protein/Flp pilus assembly protein TadD
VATANQGPPDLPKIARFGAYEADARNGELRKSGMRLKLSVQPFQVLTILLEKRGDLVTREELRDRIWPSGTFVDFENSLNKAVAKLRAILNDDPSSPRFIETVPRRGYRFLAPVEFIETEIDRRRTNGSAQPASNGSGVSSVVEAPFAPAKSQPKMRAKVAWMVSGVLALTLLIAAAVSLPGRTQKPWIANSVAILPFENLSGDPAQDYFVAGMTDEVISDLAKIKSLRVAPSSSVERYQSGKKPLADIARELGVDALVQGSVTRVGDRVRITARMTDPWQPSVRWVESYDCDLRDLVVTETQIAKHIGLGIHANFDAEEDRFFSQTAHRVVPEAHEAYLRGHYLLNKHGGLNAIRESCDDFQKAMAADPNFPPAYEGMALCMQWQETRRYISHAESNAETFALKAVELDPASVQAHAVLGSLYLYHDWNWGAARQELQRAVQSGPNNAQAHFLYSEYLKIMGRLPQALVEIRRAQALDPLEFHYGNSAGYFFLYMHRFDEAELEFKQVLQMDPEEISALTGLAEVYEKKQMLKQAAETWQSYENEEDQKPQVPPFMETYEKRGFAAAKQQYLEARIRLGEEKFKHGVQWEKLNLAYLNAMLGRKKQALNYLQLAYAAHLTPMVNLKVDSRFDTLRDQQEFQELLKRMKLSAED